MTSKFPSFLWPDHIIGKRESRRIREEHNALCNSHAELLAAARQMSADFSAGKNLSAAMQNLDAAIVKAT